MNAPGFILRLSFILALGLSLWVGIVAGVIEFQNARADYYLPRHDLYDGKWRISMEDTPRDRLRGLVSGVGLFQYLLAPLCIFLGSLNVIRQSEIWRRRAAIVFVIVGVAAVSLAIYRGYFSSID